MKTERFRVPDDLDGERLDKVVAGQLSLSRGTVSSIIGRGGVTLDDDVAKASTRVTAGSSVVVVLPDIDVSLTPEPDVPFTVVYEDDHVVVVDKPSGVTVHPGAGRATGTLAAGLLARYPEIRGVGQEDRWGIVHRLDRETSGLLVVARTTEAYEGLRGAMDRREISRQYAALVVGLFGNTTGTIEAPIGRDPSQPTRMAVGRTGRDARTHYRRVADWADAAVSLLAVTLETGRTHQIRVHMRSIDHPIVGDRVYGAPNVQGDPGRPWLHARRLTFAHPVTGASIDVFAALPDDLTASLAILGPSHRGDIDDIDGGVT